MPTAGEQQLMIRRRGLHGVRQSLLADALAGVVSDWSACGAVLQIVAVRAELCKPQRSLQSSTHVTGRSHQRAMPSVLGLVLRQGVMQSPLPPADHISGAQIAANAELSAEVMPAHLHPALCNQSHILENCREWLLNSRPAGLRPVKLLL